MITPQLELPLNVQSEIRNCLILEQAEELSQKLGISLVRAEDACLSRSGIEHGLSECLDNLRNPEAIHHEKKRADKAESQLIRSLLYHATQ